MKFNVRTICMIAMLTAVTSVLSIMQIPTPWGVPFTLQTAAVALSGYVLGEKYGTISTILYVLLGTIGVPVFAGMSAGPGLMFVSLPKVFKAMGAAGVLVGTVFFLMVSFAAVTSSVSVMEAIVSSMMDKFHVSRKKGTILTTLYGMIVGVIVCLGYNKLYFEFKLPNGTVAQILDVMDYISNNCLMPMVALLTCILIGWVVKPKAIIDEVTLGGYRFGREKLYIAMIKVIAPLMLLVLLVQSVGL